MDYRENIEINTAQNVSLELPLAGIGSRLLAQISDLLILFIFELLMIIIVSSFGKFWVYVANWVAPVLIILNFIVIWGYFPLMEYFNNGQTLGKKMYKIKVKSDNGGNISFGAAIIRNLIRIVDFLPGFYGIGLIVMFFNKKNKRLGDIVSGTIVLIDYRQKFKVADTVRSSVEEEIDSEDYSEELIKMTGKIKLDNEKYQYIINYLSRKNSMKAKIRNTILISFFEKFNFENCPQCKEKIESFTIAQKEKFVELLKKYYEK